MNTAALARKAGPFGKADHFGWFEIKEVVGMGGQGIVYRAYDHQLQRTVALKELFGGTLASTARERILSEARCLARIMEDPCICSI